MQQILTPTGYRPIVDLEVGDEVLAFDLAIGAEIVNRVETKQWVDLAEWFRWHNDGREEVPDFRFIRLNGAWTLNSEQSLWVKRAGEYVVCHARLLEIGDEIYDGSDRPFVVWTIEEVIADGWWRFDISGDHSYICDDLTLHNASRFWVGGTASWTAANTASWSGSSGGAGGSSVPGSSDTVTIDGSSGAGTITVNFGGTVTVQSITCGAMGMTLDFAANDNPVTLSATGGFSGSGSGTRTINLGDGTWTLNNTSANSTPWTMTTTTNLTWNANSSTILINGGNPGNTRTFGGGGLAYNALTISSALVSIVGTNSFTTVTLTGPAGMMLPASVTTTMTGLSSSGSSSASSQNYVGSASSTAGATISIASSTQTLNWTGIRNVAFSGGATFVGTNCFDLNGNTGITITAPSGGGSVGVIGG